MKSMDMAMEMFSKMQEQDQMEKEMALKEKELQSKGAQAQPK